MERDFLIDEIETALDGRFAHPDPVGIVSGLDAAEAGERPPGAPRSIYQILGHVRCWQDLSVAWIGGEEPPDHGAPEETWPADPNPGSEEAWADEVRRFADGIVAAKAALGASDLTAPLAGLPEGTTLGCLLALATHNSFHLGQIVLLRRRLDAWPPAEDVSP